MSSPGLRIPLLVIGGPTAVGKTDIGVQVAEAVGGEIVSADSMQIYKGMDVGTAKPTSEQQARARFHLVDIVQPDEPYNVAMFKRDAQQAIKAIHQRGNLPIMCGGTGLYIQALLEHYDFPPAPEDKQIRQRLHQEAEEIGTAGLHRRLREVDPQTAAQLSPNDLKRIIRALEVYELTGEPVATLQSVDHRPRLQYNSISFVVTCPRAMLYRRIEQRTDRMVAAGWVEEAKQLVGEGCHAGLQSMQAIGYRHILEFLAGTADWPATVKLIKRDSRRFAKRQLTWFRHQSDSTWLQWANKQQFEGTVETIVAAARQLVADSK